jgi:hypothetical protein
VLKKQLESNPTAVQKHARVMDLEAQLKHLSETLDPDGTYKPSCLQHRLGCLEKLQDSIHSSLVSILEKIQ